MSLFYKKPLIYIPKKKKVVQSAPAPTPTALPPVTILGSTQGTDYLNNGGSSFDSLAFYGISAGASGTPTSSLNGNGTVGLDGLNNCGKSYAGPRADYFDTMSGSVHPGLNSYSLMAIMPSNATAFENLITRARWSGNYQNSPTASNLASAYQYCWYASDWSSNATTLYKIKNSNTQTQPYKISITLATYTIVDTDSSVNNYLIRRFKFHDDGKANLRKIFNEIQSEQLLTSTGRIICSHTNLSDDIILQIIYGDKTGKQVVDLPVAI